MASDSKFAVLIDADNVSDKYIKIILDEISTDGIATYKRIYGDWTKPALSSWKNILLDNSILPIQQYNYTTGKNSTDSALIIDAMDILYSGQVDGFCLVSSDSDFTRLAARLRESGMLVVGMGESKTPKSFISACNRFKYLDILFKAERDKAAAEKARIETAAQTEAVAQQEKSEKPEKPESARQKPPQKQRQQPSKEPTAPVKEQETHESKPEPPVKAAASATDLATITAAVRAIVAENSDEDDWMFVGTIGNLLVKRYPDFDVRNFGFSKLTPFVESLELFDIKSVRTHDSSVKLIYVHLR